MGKRSDFERKPRDFYPTPMEAVEPLLPHLPEGFKFAEPCAGDGALVEHLETKGACMWASDIEPQHEGIHESPYDKLGFDEFIESDYIITNPPWDRKILHPMIAFFTLRKDTWLLFDSDLTPAGKNVLDGRYPVFGYVVEGADFLRDIKEDDVIVSAKVTDGLQFLVQPK